METPLTPIIDRICKWVESKNCDSLQKEKVSSIREDPKQKARETIALEENSIRLETWVD